jgi:hypothetical protein
MQLIALQTLQALQKISRIDTLIDSLYLDEIRAERIAKISHKNIAPRKSFD